VTVDPVYEDISSMLQSYIRVCWMKTKCGVKRVSAPPQEDMPPAPPEIGALIGILVRLIAADRYWRLAPGRPRVIRAMVGDSFDLVFIDTAKSETPSQPDEAIRLVRSGGLVIGDDVRRCALARPSG
jgi:hypothetical protein